MRAVANVGFDVMDAAFSGAASAVTGLGLRSFGCGGPRRGAVRRESRVVTGVTGGVRSTVGGVVGGGTAVVGGSLAAGRASCKARRRAILHGSARRAGRLPVG